MNDSATKPRLPVVLTNANWCHWLFRLRPNSVPTILSLVLSLWLLLLLNDWLLFTAAEQLEGGWITLIVWRLINAFIFTGTILIPVAILIKMDESCHRVAEQSPESNLSSLIQSRGRTLADFWIGALIGFAIMLAAYTTGVFGEGGWRTLFLLPQQEPWSILVVILAILILGPGSAVLHLNYWRYSLWLRDAARKVEIDLLRVHALEVFAEPVVRFLAVSLYSLAFAPLVFLLSGGNDEGRKIGIFLLILALIVVASMVIPSLAPLRVLRQRIAHTKQRELEFIMRAYAGDQTAFKQTRMSTLQEQASFSDLLAYQQYIESIWDIPMVSQFRRLMVLVLVPVCSWITLFLVEEMLSQII